MRKNNSKRNSVLCVFILREWVEKCLSFGLMVLAQLNIVRMDFYRLKETVLCVAPELK